MANMVYLIQIASICGEVQLNAWRCQNSLRVGHTSVMDQAIRQKLGERLENWAHTYNIALRAKGGDTSDSTTRPSSNGDVGGARANKFAGLDVLFHWTHMELNRRVYHKNLTQTEILRHAWNAKVHAAEVLKLSKQLLEPGGQGTRDYHFVTRGPLAGYAILAAIDIITAAGTTRDIVEPDSKIMSYSTTVWSSLKFSQLGGTVLSCSTSKQRSGYKQYSIQHRLQHTRAKHSLFARNR